MKCSRLTLFDRKAKSSRDLSKHEGSCQRIYHPQLHNYLPWLNKPHSVYEDEQPYLTVCNLVLPKSMAVSADRGAQSDRWKQKQPRLQSAKLKILKEWSKTLDNEDNGAESHQSEEEERDSELMEIQQVMEEYEIDENVQRLIQEAAEYDVKFREKKAERPVEKQSNDADELNKRRRRKSSKHKTTERSNETKEKAKPKLSRTVTLSLSRPPSPETIQVIRVDVTSNYSLEEPEILDEDEDEDGRCADAGERRAENSIKYEKNQLANSVSNRLYAQKSLIKGEPSARELTLQCQKLALADRNSTRHCEPSNKITQDSYNLL